MKHTAMKKNKYHIHIWWEDDAFFAEVPALPGCISHGASYEEAVKNVQEAMDAWLAVAGEHSDPIPEPDYTVEQIKRLEPILNLSALARLSGINHHTLASKLRRGSKLNREETIKIKAVLNSVYQGQGSA